MNQIEVKPDDLPVLPFEKILSYLSLVNQIRLRGVSRKWLLKIDSFQVKSLFYSERPIGFIYQKSQLVSGVFAQNFISSPRFELFFHTFIPTILASLKHLRLCKIGLTEENKTAFVKTLESFGGLKELGLFSFNLRADSGLSIELELSLPLLRAIHLEDLDGIEKLTLKAPKLQQIKLQYCDTTLNLDLVHAESVKLLVVDRLEYTEIKQMKNLHYLYMHVCDEPEIDSTPLSDLEQLKEIRLTWTDHQNTTPQLFDQKQRYDRAHLKIFYFGLLLNGPQDPAMAYDFDNLSDESLGYLIANQSRLADEIPLCSHFYYKTIQRVSPELTIDIVKRFTSLAAISVSTPVRDHERFLNFLKVFSNIERLGIYCGQPQELFDRLPDHTALQNLSMHSPPLDLGFIYRLKNLIFLEMRCSIDAETIRKLFKRLEFLSWLEFSYLGFKNSVIIQADQPGHLKVSVNGERTEVPDLNAAIQFIEESTR